MNVKRAAFQTVGSIAWAAYALVCGNACDRVDPNLIRELTKSDPGQDHSKGDPEIDDNDVTPVPPDMQPEAFSWQGTTFDYPRDQQSCDGQQFVRIADQGIVGVVECGNGAVRVYYSEDPRKSFWPMTDTAGHGQDHCEFVNPHFAIANEDDITSGGCEECSTGENLPLEGVKVYSRAVFGEPLKVVDRTPQWSHQVSRLRCGVDVSVGATPAK